MKIPLVLQYNKRDLQKKGLPIMSVDKMNRELNRQLNAPSFSASVLTGKGVGAALTQTMKLTLQHLHQEFQWSEK